MALVNPHPALKVSVPMNPMVDGWRGDDWFHNGAFRQQGLPYIDDQQATRDNKKRWSAHYDDYDLFLEAGTGGCPGPRARNGAARLLAQDLEHPAYDAYWRDQAVDRILAAQPLGVPATLVHSLWDQEDIYGAPAVWKAIKPKDKGNDTVFLVLGPWYHSQEIHDGSALGAIRFDSDTARSFRREILRPFLDQYLKPGAPKADIAPVMAYETGTNSWRRLTTWPAGCASGCTPKPTPLYLGAGSRLGWLHRWPAPRSSPSTSGPGQARPLHPSPRHSRELRRGAELARVAGLRPARRREPPGRPRRSRRRFSPHR